MWSSLLAGAAIAAGAAAAVAAADLWSRRAIKRFESLDPESIALPGARFWVRGVAVHTIQRGYGFPVVLIHGFGSSIFTFRFLIPALADRFRVIAVDLPGFGYSDRGARTDYSQNGWVALLTEFLARQGVGRAVFVGHSLGGSVAQRLTLQHPELVERLVLVSSVSATEPPRLPRMAIGPVLRVVQAVTGVMPHGRGYERASRGTVYDPAYLRPAILDEYVRPLKLPGSAAAMRQIVAGMRRETPLDVTAILVPTLLLWGEHDRTVPLDTGERLQQAIAGSRLEIVPEAAHLVLEEQPERCNRLIGDFLADLALQGTPKADEAPGQTLVEGTPS